MLTERQKQLLFEEIDRVPTFRGVGVAFVGEGQCRLLRKQAMPEGLRTWIVLQEEEEEVRVAWPSQPAPPPRERHIGRELANMGVSCVSAGLAGVAEFGTVGAAPVTGGASLVASVLTWTTLVTSTLQCANGSWRLFNEIFNPEMNDALDSSEWYQFASDVIDAAADACAIGSLG